MGCIVLVMYAYMYIYMCISLSLSPPQWPPSPVGPTIGMLPALQPHEGLYQLTIVEVILKNSSTELANILVLSVTYMQYG